MGNERVSKLVLTFDGEEGTIASVLSSIKSQVRSAVTDLENTTKKVALFGDLETRVKSSSEALFDASTKAKLLAQQLDAVNTAGGKATPDLISGLKAANTELKNAENAYNRNVDALTRQHNALSRIGVDTSNAARAQLQLTQATQQAAAAAEIQAAKQLLGLTTLQQVQPQIQKLNAAYVQLRDSGVLSATQVAIAQQKLHDSTEQVNASVTKLRSNAGETLTQFTSVFQTIQGRMLAIATAVYSAAKAFDEVTDASERFENSIAKIGTISTLSTAQLADLGEKTRALSVELGVNLDQALQGVFDLIRSGVPPDNAVEVLALSAKAAKASFADLGAGVKASSLLLSGFGVDLGDLGGALDIVVKGAQLGGPSLAEFADAGGKLANAARAAKVPLVEVEAALITLHGAGVGSERAMETLADAIVKLGEPAVRGKLHDIGIDSTDLLEIMTQLGQRGIPVDKFVELGIASAKTSVSLSSLTNNTAKLQANLAAVQSATGAVNTALGKLSDTPAHHIDLFTAALTNAKVALGEQLISAARALDPLTKLLNLYASLTKTIGAAGSALQGFGGKLGATPFGPGLSAIAGVTQLLTFYIAKQKEANAASVAGIGAIHDSAKAELADIDAAIAKQRADLDTISARLLKTQADIQGASTQDLANLQERADAQIAALDRSSDAELATAAKTIAIQTKLAADRLAVIQKSEADVLAAATTAATAREKIERTSGVSERQIAVDTAKIRADALAGVLKQYQDEYNAQIGIAQNYQQKINAIETDRIAFNQGIQNKLFEIRLQSLSGLDQYAARVKAIDDLIAQAQVAADKGRTDLVKNFIDQIDAQSAKLGQVVNADGNIVISAFDAQQKVLSITKREADLYNTSLDKQDTLAKDGFAAAKKGADDLLPRIQALRAEFDALNAIVEKGIHLSVSDDIKGLDAAESKLDDLARDRTVNLTVTVTGPDGLNLNLANKSTPDEPAAQFGQPTQVFAGGGNVLAFRRPSWSKVPGSGNGDTVPAGLASGSFVMRKAASSYYGDAALSKIARGYASGGPVTQLVNPVTGAILTSVPQQSDVTKFFGTQSDYFGDIKSGTQASVRDVGTIGPPTLPSDPKELIRKILEYANAVVVAANPERYTFDRAITQLNAELRQFDRDQNTDTLMQALQTARAIGLNLGVSTGKLFGFDVDGRKWHKEQVYGSFGALGFSPDAASYNFYAGGGSVGDTVPAMLTPGEYVFNPRAVAMYGGGFLGALNRLEVPKGYLDNVLSFPARSAAGSVAHFAEGGPVGGSVSMSSARVAANSGGDKPLVVNLYGVGRLDNQEIDRVVTVINRKLKRSA